MSARTVPASDATADARNPYLGLASFSEGDASYFFGRTAERAELAQMVKRDTLTVVYGLSGLGKTSLLQAGLFPTLRAAEHLPIPIRLVHREDLPPLADQVREQIRRQIEAHEVDARAPTRDETLWSYFHRVPFWDRQNRTLVPVLAFDQMEELFTVARSRDEVRELLEEVADLVENRIPDSVRRQAAAGADADALPRSYTSPKAKVVLALREDFLPRLDDLRPLMPSLSRNRFRLRRMNREQAFDAVYNDRTRHLLPDPSVAGQIVRFVAATDERVAVSRPSTDEVGIEPALLSLVCQKLNDLRQERGEAALSIELLSGESHRVIRNFYDQAVDGMGRAARVFLEERLLTADGSYRTTCARSDAERAEGVSPAVIDRLIQRRLLRVEDRLGIEHVELVHDVLTRVVRDSRDERRERERSARIWRAVVGVFTVLAIAVGGFSARRHSAKLADELAKAVLRGRNERAAEGAKALFLEGRRQVGEAREAAARVLALANGFAEDSGRAPPLGLGVLTARTLRGFEGLDGVFDAHVGSVTEVAFAPDGDRLATAGRDGTIVILRRTGDKWSFEWRLVHPGGDLPHPSPRQDAEASDLFAQSDPDAARDRHRRRTEKSTHDEPGDTHPVRAAAFGPGGLLAIVDDAGGTLWNVTSRAVVGHFQPAWPSERGALAFSPNGKWLLARGNDSAQVWSTARGPDGALETIRLVEASPDPPPSRAKSRHRARPVAEPRVLAARFAPHGTRFAVARSDNKALIWDLGSHGPAQTLRHPDEVNDVVFSPDGRTVATACDDRAARIWDIGSGRLIQRLAEASAVAAVDYDGSGRRLVAQLAGAKRVHVWANASEGVAGALPHFRFESGRGSGGALGPRWRVVGKNHDRILMLTDGEGILRSLEPRGGSTTFRYYMSATPGAPASVHSVSADAAMLAVGYDDGKVRLWRTTSTVPFDRDRVLSHDLAGAAEALPGEMYFGPINAIAVPRSGAETDAVFATLGRDGALGLWEVFDDRLVVTSRRMVGAELLSGEFSRDGHRLVTTGADHLARVWDVPSGRTLAELGDAPGCAMARSATISPDGSAIVTAGREGCACLWRVEPGSAPTCHALSTRFGQTGLRASARSVTYDSTGARIAIAFSDGRISLCDAHLGGCRELPGHEGHVNVLAFQANGHLLSASEDGSVRTWDEEGRAAGVVRVPRVHSGAYDADADVLVAVPAGSPAHVYGRGLERLATLGFGDAGAVDLAPHGGAVLTCSGGAARLWALPGGRLAWHTQTAFAADGSCVARFVGGASAVVTASSSGWVSLWRLPDEGARDGDGHHGPVDVASFVDDGKTVISIDQQGELRRWGTALAQGRTLSAAEAASTRSVLPEVVGAGRGDSVLVVRNDGAIERIGGVGGVTLRRDPSELPASAVIDGEDRIIVVDQALNATIAVAGASRDGGVAPSTWTPALSHHRAPVVDAAFASDGTPFTASQDGTIAEWDPSTFARRTEYRPSGERAYGHPLERIVLDPQKSALVAAFAPGLFVTWTRGGAAPTALESRPSSGLEAVALTRGAVHRLTATHQSFEASSLDDSTRVRHHLPDYSKTQIVVDPKGLCALTLGGAGGVVDLWGLDPFEHRARLRAPEGANRDPSDRAVTTAEISPSGEVALVVTSDRKATLWRTSDGKLLGSLAGAEPISWATFALDGKTVIAAGETSLTTWNVGTRRLVSRSPPVIDASRVIAIPGGLLVAAVVSEAARACERCAIATWDAGTNELRPKAHVLDAPVSQLRASADGSRLLTVTSDGTAQLWEVQPRLGNLSRDSNPTDRPSDRPLLRVGYERFVAAAFTTRGPRLLTTDGTGNLDLWDFASREPIAR